MPHNQRKIIIAIDGYSSCGKSTLARGLARRLQYLHVDSGAMYRAVTLHFLRHHVDIHDPDAVAGALDDIHVHLSFEPEAQSTWLNHERVDEAIRDPHVSAHVSEVSAISAVRRAMVEQQRRLGRKKGIVMDGRDIGTVVFPDAELKLFITADPDVRVERRWLELQAKGIDISREEIRDNLRHRDAIDSSRTDSPLRQADDATVIDTSYLTPQEQLQVAFDLARAIIGSPAFNDVE
jgi:cytidylate kinase